MTNKTEMVSVPRELIHTAVNGYVQAQGPALNELRELLLNTPPSDATHYWPRCPDKKRQWRKLEDGWWCVYCGFKWLRLDHAMEEEYLPIASPAEDVRPLVDGPQQKCLLPVQVAPPHPPRHTGFMQPGRETPGYTIEQMKEYGAACVAAFIKQTAQQ